MIKLTPEMCSRMKFISVSDYSKMISRNERIVYKMIREGKINYICIGKAFRIPVFKEDWEEYQVQLKLDDEQCEK